jgi:hypothetical protein
VECGIFGRQQHTTKFSVEFMLGRLKLNIWRIKKGTVRMHEPAHDRTYEVGCAANCIFNLSHTHFLRSAYFRCHIFPSMMWPSLTDLPRIALIFLST